MEAEEKKGGVPFRLSTCLDFINCMDDCGMTDSSFVGNVHTWCNWRGGAGIIKIRLDRLMHNKEWATKFPNITVEHLSKIGSDHNLLLETEVYDNPMWRLHQKLKILAKELSKWSREGIRDLLKRVKDLEKDVAAAKTAYLALDSDSDGEHFNRSKAEYIRWLKMEDSILRQKARLKWAEDGDSNTNQMFTGNTRLGNLDFVRDCDNLINDEDNILLTKIPTIEEIKMAIDSMDPNSCAGPDGYNGHFSNIVGTLSKLRINSILPKIISDNQLGFVKGRQITENILLTQDIVHGIRKMVFDEMFIKLVYRLISNNWYLVIINGTRYGFFKSSGGLKQGNPLSPALFIIAAETLSRALN
ncbi:uncharacterized protein LOC132628766 [Lycium barbarum]|uniref:uncharacterized protein LOC132628766 n=1 Tax=Lycium barbarum TaxID=112863 RepID=UPI00293E4FD7|nr:uncharacterized protein LOC132628766 [Lycium barbarum]